LLICARGQAHKDRLAFADGHLSVHSRVFEGSIKEICDLIHELAGRFNMGRRESECAGGPVPSRDIGRGRVPLERTRLFAFLTVAVDRGMGPIGVANTW